MTANSAKEPFRRKSIVTNRRAVKFSATVKMTGILIVFLVLWTFWRAKHFANRIGAAATTKLCWFLAGVWAFSFFSVWLILFVSQFAEKTPYWPHPWKSVVSVIYGLTCILPLPVLSLAPYTK
jgi:hypothetical protein